MAEVFLHVGLPKTGTTTIQAALEENSTALARQGVLVPGGRHRAHRLAVYDLIGQRVSGDDPRDVHGAFARLAAEIDAFEGERVVVSDELLSQARPRHVRRVVDRLEQHRVSVVVGVRDLPRTLVSAWHQSVGMGGRLTWPEFLAAVRDPSGGPSSAEGVAFWIRHDALRALDAWASAVPPDRVTVVTVPPAGSPPETLVDRFSAAVGLPPGSLRPRSPRLNQALGPAQVEVVRRLNASIAAPLTKRQYKVVVEDGIRPGLPVQESTPLALPPEHLAWSRSRSEELAAELHRRGYRVVGDLADLVHRGDGPPAPPLEVSTEDLLEATQAALASLALAHGRLYARFRRQQRRSDGTSASAGEVLGSTARSVVFGLQKTALKQADTSPILARAAQVYLRRTLGRNGRS